MKFYSQIEKCLLIALFTIGVAFICFFSISKNYSEHYSLLAYSLIRGHFNLIFPSNDLLLDTVVISGKTYFAGDPAAAIFMLPLAFIFSSLNNTLAPQWIPNLITIFLTILALNKLLNLHKVNSGKDKAWIIYCFIFGSSYISTSIIPNSWNFPQTIGVCLTFFYLLSWKQKKFLLSLFLILLITFTRKQLLLPVFVFSVVDALLNYKKISQKVILIFLVTLTTVISYKSFKYWYYKNFAIPIGAGHLSASYSLPLHQSLIKLHGQFNFIYLPRNIYYYLLKSPEPIFQSDIIGSHLKWPFIEPSPTGTGFIFLTPIVLAFIFIKLPPIKSVLPYFVAFGSLLSVYLTLFTTGEDQLGLRYSVDFLPFIFVPLALVLQTLTSKLKFFIVCSSAFNLYLVYAFFSTGKTI